MGTRGVYGFYKYGVNKLTYNHYDSYPSGLGKNILNFLQLTSIAELNEIFDRIILVRETKKPTKKQREEMEKVINGIIKESEDWYSVLRQFQGYLDRYKEGLRYMVDNNNFIKDSLFCEWGYVINLDTNKLEIYKGFQKKPQQNRYKVDVSDNGYYNCALIDSLDIQDLDKEIKGSDY